MSELTIEQAQQRHAELSFLSKHHEELSKHYLRESILTEQAIRQAKAQVAPEKPVEAAPEKPKRPEVGRELVEKVESAIELVNNVVEKK